MTTIALVAAKVAQVYSDPAKAEIHNVVAAEAITKGEVLYQTTTGTFGLCDMDMDAKDEPRGMALQAAAAGEALSMIKYGPVYGFTLAGLAYDAPVYASTTAGEVDTAGWMLIGRVMPATDRLKTKVLFVDFPDWVVRDNARQLDGVGFMEGGVSGTPIETDEVLADWGVYSFWESWFKNTGAGVVVGRRVHLELDSLNAKLGFAGRFEFALKHVSGALPLGGAGLQAMAYLGPTNTGISSVEVLAGLTSTLTIAADTRVLTGYFTCLRLQAEVGANNTLPVHASFIHANDAGIVKIPTFLNVEMLTSGNANAVTAEGGTYGTPDMRLRVNTSLGLRYIDLNQKTA